MQKIKLGLAKGKVALYDKRTNTTFSLSQPVRDVFFNSPEELEDLVRALVANPPSLILYEGEIPQEAKDAVENRFKVITHGSPVTYQDLSGDFVTSPPNNVMDRVESNITARETKADELVAEASSVTLAQAAQAVEEIEEEKPKSKRRTSAKNKEESDS